MTQTNRLDQFFTKSDVAEHCFSLLDDFARRYVNGDGNFTYIEPSAGSGAFLEPLKKASRKFRAFDIDPQGTDGEIIPMDFLTVIDEDLRDDKDENLVFVGNPPFGKRASLAVRFLNIALDYSPLVGFILPIQFDKFLTQKQVKRDARLVFREALREDAFIEDGKNVNVRTVFQIWTNGLDTDEPDLRIRETPATKHEDFEMFIYNCTKQAEKYFDYNWDFAVRRQGWGTLEIVPKERKDTLDRRRQYMFFKTNDDAVLERLKNIDYTALGKRNTSVSGFGKADVVSEYLRLYC